MDQEYFVVGAFHRPVGRHQQQNQNHETPSLWVSRPRVLPTQNTRNPSNQVRFSRMNQKSARNAAGCGPSPLQPPAPPGDSGHTARRSPPRARPELPADQFDTAHLDGRQRPLLVPSWNPYFPSGPDKTGTGSRCLAENGRIEPPRAPGPRFVSRWPADVGSRPFPSCHNIRQLAEAVRRTAQSLPTILVGTTCRCRPRRASRWRTRRKASRHKHEQNFLNGERRSGRNNS